MNLNQFFECFVGEHGFLEIRIFTPDGNHSSYHTDIDEAVEKVGRWKREQADVYFGVCPRKRKRYFLEDVLEAHAVWADLDESEDRSLDQLLETLQKLPLPPSIIVQTGNGYHAYWLLLEPTTDWDTHKAAGVQLQHVLNSDPVSDRTRILRVPGTLNVKDPSEPKPVLLLEHRPYRYHLSDFLFLNSLGDGKLLHKIWTGDRRGYPSRSERDWAVVTRLVSLGLSDLAITNIFDCFPVGDRAREDEKYFKLTLQRAREKYEPDNLEVVLQDAPSVRRVSEKTNEWEFAEGSDDCLYRRRKKGGGLDRVSTFTFEPVQLLKHSNDGHPDVLVGTVRSAGYEWERVTLSRKAFTRLDALQREIDVAAWQWLGSDREVRLLLPYLMDRLREKGLPHTRATGQLGRHGDLWVGPEYTLSAAETWTPEDAPLVYLAEHNENLPYDFSPVEDEPFEDLRTRVLELLPKINEPGVLWPVLGWFFATPYKPVLKEELSVRFPTLNVFGTRGSGKTSTLLQVFSPLLGAINPVGRDCRTTRFVMLTLLGSTTSVPVIFTEYRRSSLGKRAAQSFLRYLLISYDSGQDARGRPDQTLSYYPLTAPFAVDGEDMIADPAAKERMVAVDMHPEKIAQGTEAMDAFNELTSMPLHELAARYVQFTLGQDIETLWRDAYSAFMEAFPGSLPDRVRNNYSLTALGILSYARFMGYEIENLVQFFREVLEPSLRNIVEETGRTALLVDEFVEDVVNTVALGQASRYFFYRYYEDDNVLWFHLTTALRWWFAKRRREGEEVLEKAAIKQQLQEREDEVGLKSDDYYIVGRKGISCSSTTKWMHGISVWKAYNSGLDVPASLQSSTTVVFELGGNS